MGLSIFGRLGHWALLAFGYQSKTVDTDAGIIHFLERARSGALPPVVVIHGIGASHVHFWWVLLKVRNKFSQVIVPDLPGHGLSRGKRGITSGQMISGLCQAMDHVLDEPAVFFGNSLGGLAAIRIALTMPRRIRGLLLCSPGGAFQENDALQAFLKTFQIETFSDGASFVGKVFARPPLFRWLIAPGVVAAFQHPRIRSFVTGVRSDQLMTQAQLATLTMPIRMIWGTKDALLPRAPRDWYVASLPDHADVLEPEIGHCPQLDAPNLTSTLLMAFAGEV
ncbi:MAG: alpha/beta fold hydrolase [Rhodobacterales bacterium]|nr:alpha/beta fold hydrolase [Rhodobacterales bacterium]